MAEKSQKIFPTSKPTTTAVTTTAAAAPPTIKPQFYNVARPVYRSHPHRNRRSYYCYFCLWIIFIILLLLIISAIIVAMLFLMYHPHRPTFCVSSSKLSQFNHTSSSTQLGTKFNATFLAINSNSNMVFYYDKVSVMISSKGVDIGEGLIPAFVMKKKSRKRLNVELKSNLNEKKNSLLKIVMNGKVKVKMGRYKSKKVNVRVVCNEIKAVVAGDESATNKKTKCKVDFRIKIWKWSI